MLEGHAPLKAVAGTLVPGMADKRPLDIRSSVGGLSQNPLNLLDVENALLRMMKLPETHEPNHPLKVHTVVLVVLRSHRAHYGFLILALHTGLSRNRVLV